MNKSPGENIRRGRANMSVMEDYFKANRLNWDERAPIHATSRMYALERFTDDPAAMSTIVEFDRKYFGDIAEQKAVHLQCHIGTDTISLARLGAEVAGLDQSPVSIAEAEKLFAATDTPGRFVVANVYDAVEALDDTYDLVYTGVGALNWLPDVRRWGNVVAELLKPGGRLFIREGHPMAMTLDDQRTDGELVLKYPYFEHEEPLIWDEQETYTDGDSSTIQHTRNYEWAHGLAETVMAVIDAGLVIEGLYEHKHLEWQLLPSMIVEDGVFYLPEHQRELAPMMYSILASKPA